MVVGLLLCGCFGLVVLVLVGCLLYVSLCCVSVSGCFCCAFALSFGVGFGCVRFGLLAFYGVEMGVIIDG